RPSAAMDAWSERRRWVRTVLYRSITVMIFTVPQETPRIADPDDDVTSCIERGDLGTALHHLMKRHRTPVYRYCSTALRDPVLADDVCQQIFIQAFRDLSRFHGRSKIRIWLFGIARHRILDAAKARRRRLARLQGRP